MNRILLTLATASIFAMGCGHAALDLGAAAPAPPVANAGITASASGESATPTPASDVGSDAEPAAAANARMPGDFVVYRFSGSFRKTPLTLTQRVVARKGSVLTIDLVAVEGEDREELRVTLDEATHEV